jgi:hypothetical protein
MNIHTIVFSVPTDVSISGDKHLGVYDPAGKNGWFMYSTHHTLISKGDVDAVKNNLTGMEFIATERSHYFPLEDPHVFAELVASLVHGTEKSKL